MPLPDLLEALGRSNEEEIARLVAAARSEAEGIRSAARTEAQDRLGRLLSEERARFRQTGERRKVAARREAAARVLRARAALVDRVFDAARARASAVLGWADYGQWVEEVIRRLRELLGDDAATVRCALADVDWVTARVAGSALTVVPSPDVSAGLHCTADDGRLTVDLTLPVRLLVERPALTIALGPALEAMG
ncbi:MAG: V-type ATP synthase subunit E family protein [Myxococcaceae bacterium]